MKQGKCSDLGDMVLWFIRPYGCQEPSMITALDSVVRRRDCPSCSGSRVVSQVLGSSGSAKPVLAADKDSVESKGTVSLQGHLRTNQQPQP